MHTDPASLASAGHVSMICPFAASASVVSDEILFSNASNPGNPQVQAILNTLTNVK